jgi:hypothetical protein
MDRADKPYVHLPIDAVDAVVFDPDGVYDPEVYDRYATFAEARDAALSSVELTLDEGDYDGEDHRDELERMRVLLDGAETFEALLAKAGYCWFLDRVNGGRVQAA